MPDNRRVTVEILGMDWSRHGKVRDGLHFGVKCHFQAKRRFLTCM